MRIATAFALLFIACNSGSDAPGEAAAEIEALDEAAPDAAVPPIAVNPIAAEHEAQQRGAPVDPLPLPDGECTGVAPGNPGSGPVSGTEIVADSTALGARRPSWLLQDVQPRSCGHESYYGLDSFDGPMLVVMLSAGCGYCLGQASRLDELWWDLRAEGHEPTIIIVNKSRQEARMSALLERTGLPIFQDVDEVDAWGTMGGSKDDFFYYGADGTLAAYYSSHGEVETTLAAGEGYQNARNTLLHLLGEDIELPNGGHSPHLPHGHQ